MNAQLRPLDATAAAPSGPAAVAAFEHYRAACELLTLHDDDAIEAVARRVGANGAGIVYLVERARIIARLGPFVTDDLDGTASGACLTAIGGYAALDTPMPFVPTPARNRAGRPA